MRKKTCKPNWICEQSESSWLCVLARGSLGSFLRMASTSDSEPEVMHMSGVAEPGRHAAPAGVPMFF